MDSCQNCGHDSHCGEAKHMEVKENNTDYEPYYIIICKQCRCKKCEIKNV